MINPLQRDYLKLVNRVNASIAESRNKMIQHRKVAAARVLPSRDIILTINNIEDAE